MPDKKLVCVPGKVEYPYHWSPISRWVFNSFVIAPLPSPSLLSFNANIKINQSIFKHICPPILYLKVNDSQFPTTTDLLGKSLGHPALNAQLWSLHDFAGCSDTGCSDACWESWSLSNHTHPEKSKLPWLPMTWQTLCWLLCVHTTTTDPVQDGEV